MSLSHYRSEANYAHSHRKGGGCSSKQVKLLRKATKDYNRAVRRAKKQVIADNIASYRREPIPTINGVFHTPGFLNVDEVGCWSLDEGRYIYFHY